jgi:hypothetical protein
MDTYPNVGILFVYLFFHHSNALREKGFFSILAIPLHRYRREEVAWKEGIDSCKGDAGLKSRFQDPEYVHVLST